MKIFTATFLILIASLCNAGEYEDYMNETFDLINMGEYEEALDRFIWFHKNGIDQGLTTNPSRLSFGLMYWVDFGKKYPPALDSLRKIRDENTKIFLNDKKPCELFHEIKAINSHLSEDNKTIELFKRIDQDNPYLAKRCWIYFKDTAISNDLKYFINKYIKNLNNEYDTAERQFISTMKYFYKESKTDEDLISTIKDGFISDTQELINIANTSNNTAALKYIQGKYNLIAKEYSLHGLSSH